MTLQVEFWTLATVVIGLLTGGGSLFYRMLRQMLAQEMRHIDERVANIGRRIEAIEKEWRAVAEREHELELELHRLKSGFVTREEFLRYQQALEVKLDALVNTVRNTRPAAALPATTK